MKKAKVWSNPMRKEIVLRYMRGDSVKDIADRFGLTTAAIYSAKKRKWFCDLRSKVLAAGIKAQNLELRDGIGEPMTKRHPGLPDYGKRIFGTRWWRDDLKDEVAFRLLSGESHTSIGENLKISVRLIKDVDKNIKWAKLFRQAFVEAGAKKLRWRTQYV